MITEKEKKIKKEKKKLQKIFESIDENKKKVIDSLIDRAAFIIVSLVEIEEELNETGWTEEYKNGQNQSGIKKSAAADVHISLAKNLTAIMKLLLAECPEKVEVGKLATFMAAKQKK